MRRVRIALIIILTLAVNLVASAQDRNVQPRNIVLFGWDGVGRKHLKDCLRLSELPNLQNLVAEGALVAIDIFGTTDTKAGWAQVLTGYEPWVTGVFSNHRYQPIPKGYTIFERLKDFFGAQNFVTVAVIWKKDNMSAGPGEPYYYTKDGMDEFIDRFCYAKKVGLTTLELLEKYKEKPFFFFVHFDQADHFGHKYGEKSKEYNNAIILADSWLGEIVQKLKQLNLYDKTLIYVTADHGFDEGSWTHNNAPYVFLATNDPKVMRDGQRVDIAPTILDRFGVDLSKIKPPLDGHSLTKPYKKSAWQGGHQAILLDKAN